jgi:hypothetical protein
MLKHSLDLGVTEKTVQYNYICKIVLSFGWKSRRFYFQWERLQTFCCHGCSSVFILLWKVLGGNAQPYGWQGGTWLWVIPRGNIKVPGSDGRRFDQCRIFTRRVSWHSLIKLLSPWLEGLNKKRVNDNIFCLWPQLLVLVWKLECGYIRVWIQRLLELKILTGHTMGFWFRCKNGTPPKMADSDEPLIERPGVDTGEHTWTHSSVNWTIGGRWNTEIYEKRGNHWSFKYGSDFFLGWRKQWMAKVWMRQRESAFNVNKAAVYGYVAEPKTWAQALIGNWRCGWTGGVHWMLLNLYVLTCCYSLYATSCLFFLDTHMEHCHTVCE